MPCQSCSSVDQAEFTAEMNIHFPGTIGLNKPTVWVFPRILVCLRCGFTQFTIANAELRQLADPDSLPKREGAAV